jgi:hypothetical protein
LVHFLYIHYNRTENIDGLTGIFFHKLVYS